MSTRIKHPLCMPRAAAACGAIAAAVLAAGATVAAPAAADRGARDRVIAEVTALEERCNEAYAKNDLQTYWDCYAGDMTQFYDKGRLDLPEYRRLWEKEIAGGGAVLEVKTGGLKVHVSPALDAAVAVYRIFVKMRGADGTVTEGWNQETDALFKIDGRWKIVHLHYSAAPRE